MKLSKLVLVAYVVTSCGTRRVETNTTHLKANTELISTSNDSIHSNVKIIESEASNELIYEPIDSTKGMVIDGTTYSNVKIKKLTITKEKKVEDTSKEYLNSKTKLNQKTSKQEKNKESYKKGFELPTWLWLIITLIIGFILYGISRKI